MNVVNTSAFDAILQASPVVQLTLLILIVLSILCWAVGYAKYKQLQAIKASNGLFLLRFAKTNSLDSLHEDAHEFKDSSVARVFEMGYLEMKKLATGGQLKPSSVDNLERALRKAIDTEIEALESRLTILATTGSTGPFIGLFGTVWGIMGSFHKIGQTGSASLAVVAPGISEALVATAIGLAAAIPAVVLYNNFVSQIKKQENELNNFAVDFLNIVKRNFIKD